MLGGTSLVLTGLVLLFHKEMESTPPFEPDDVPDEDFIDDSVAIERVERGALWFEGGIGPVQVSKEASDLAQVGWGVNIVLAQLRGKLAHRRARLPLALTCTS